MELEFKLFLNGKEVKDFTVDEYHVHVCEGLMHINVDLFKRNPVVKKTTNKKARPKRK